MKKFLSLLLTLCLLLGILPSQALAYVGDILPSTGSTVTTETRACLLYTSPSPRDRG